MKPCSNVEKTIIDVVYFKKYKTEDSENIAVSITTLTINTVQSTSNSI